NPEAVRQAQSLVNQEDRNHTTVDVHGDDPEQRKLALKQEFLSADDKRQERVRRQAEHGSKNGSGNADICSRNQVILLKNGRVVLQGPFSRPQINSAAQRIGSVVEGYRQCVQYRIQRDYQKTDHKNRINDRK